MWHSRLGGEGFPLTAKGNRLSVFDIAADGGLGPRRDWAVFGPLVQSESINDYIAGGKVAADGGVLDAEGAVWLADAVGNRALRVAEGLTTMEEVIAATPPLA